MTWQLMWRDVRAAALNVTLQLLVIYRFLSLNPKNNYGMQFFFPDLLSALTLISFIIFFIFYFLFLCWLPRNYKKTLVTDSCDT